MPCAASMARTCRTASRPSISGIMMSMQIRSYGCASLQGGAKRVHGFPAVDRDVTFAVAGKKGLQQKPAGEIVFHQKHPQMPAAWLRQAGRGIATPSRGARRAREQTGQIGHDCGDVGLVAGAGVPNQFVQRVGGAQQDADPLRRGNQLDGSGSAPARFPSGAPGRGSSPVRK